MEKAKKAIKLELDMLKNELISEHELSKLKNSVESSLLYSEVSALNKAISLAYFEILGDAEMINIEAERYHNVTAEDIRNAAQTVFREENCSEVLYEATEA